MVILQDMGLYSLIQAENQPSMDFALGTNSEEVVVYLYKGSSSLSCSTCWSFTMGSLISLHTCSALTSQVKRKFQERLLNDTKKKGIKKRLKLLHKTILGYMNCKRVYRQGFTVHGCHCMKPLCPVQRLPCMPLYVAFICLNVNPRNF